LSELQFQGVTKSYGRVVAVQDFTLSVPPGVLAVVLGPSGCGKSTLLRLVAGLEKPDRGSIFLGRQRLDPLEPKDRGVAMVFQNYALFPHMTVRANLAFGPRLRGESRRQVEEKVRAVAERLGLSELLDRYPSELSGGQRQRVALGRALVREPRVFLFDEPLSNLDAQLRVEMRRFIMEIHRELRRTTLYVTHDQVEAMTLGEMVVVMDRGRIRQVGTPEECYRRPADTFVASFLGHPPMNLLPARVGAGGRVVLGSRELPLWVPAPEGEPILLGFRPEDARLGRGRGIPLGGEVRFRELLGSEVLVRLSVEGQEVAVKVPAGFALDEGTLELSLPPEAVHLFASDGGHRLEVRAKADGGEVGV